MTVATTTSRVEYSGNAVTLAFSVPFYFLANADLKVYVAGVLQTLTTHYSVSGAGNPAGGTVTFVTAPGSGAAVVVLRDPAVLQETDYAPNDPFPAESHEQALDKLTMIAQRLTERAGRSVAFPDGYAGGASPELPLPVANQFLRWNATPDALENADVLSQGLIGVPVPVASGGHGTTTAAGGRKALGSRFLRLEDYGGGVGVTDNTPALNALAADAAAQGIYTLALDVGTYGFTTKPNDFTIGLQIIGAGISLSGLKRNYSAGGNDEGFLTWTHAANGGGFSHVSIVAGNNSTGGTMVKFRAPASGQGASYCVADDFFLSYDAGSSYHRALFVDGVGNNLVGGQGLRDLRLSRAFIFKPVSGSGTYLIEVRNAVNHQWSDLWTNGAMLISGGGTTETNTTVFNLTNGTVFGELYVENSSGVLISNLRAAANAIFAATTTEGMFVGSIATGLNNFSSSFLVLDRAYSLARDLSSSGFLNLPNGLKIQWFVANSITTSFVTFNFPSAFSTALLNVQVTPVTAKVAIAVQSGTTTGIDMSCASGTTSAYVFAVGY